MQVYQQYQQYQEYIKGEESIESRIYRVQDVYTRKVTRLECGY